MKHRLSNLIAARKAPSIARGIDSTMESDGLVPNSDEGGDEEVSFLQRLTGRSMDEGEVGEDSGMFEKGDLEDQHRDKRVRRMYEVPAGVVEESGLEQHHRMDDQLPLPPSPRLSPIARRPSPETILIPLSPPINYHDSTLPPAHDEPIVMKELTFDDVEISTSHPQGFATSSLVPDYDTRQALGIDNDLEFDGDDMWDGFDDYELGSGLEVRATSSEVKLVALKGDLTSEKEVEQVVDDQEEENEEQYDQELTYDPALILQARNFQLANVNPGDGSDGPPPAFKSIRGAGYSLSEAAITRAKAILAVNDQDALEPHGLHSTGLATPVPATPIPSPLLDTFTDVAANFPDEEEAGKSLLPDESTEADFIPPAQVTFAFVGKRARPPPIFTAAALEKAGQLFTSPPQTAHITTPSRPTTMPNFGGFSSGGGNAVAGPSKESVALVEKKFDSDVRDVFAASSPDRVKMWSEKTFAVPKRVEDEAQWAVLPRSPPRRRVSSSQTSPTKSQHHIASSLPPSSPPPQAPNSTTDLPPPAPVHRPAIVPPSEATPNRIPIFRPPMLQNRSSTPLNHRSHALGSPFASTSKISNPLVKTAPALRRLNIGMTPRAKPPTALKFTTPFKGGVRPVGLTPVGVVSVGKRKVEGEGEIGGERKESREMSKGEGKEIAKTGESPRATRISTDFVQDDSQPGLDPLAPVSEDAISLGVPQEAISMDFVSAVAFTFACGRGESQAFEEIIKDCPYLTLPWLKNQWSLIVWKLASIVRTQPDLLSKYWNWEAAVDQLRYRYEKEVNLAQRSIIRRIQEHDSPSTLPMFLCVTQIIYDDPPDSEFDYSSLKVGEKVPKVVVGVELTDEWYRIRGNVDKPLRRACESGVIVVGSKLAVSGAKLESSREGTEVLEALKVSTLLLTANCAARTSFSTPLGLAPRTFISALDSINPEGGVVPLIDIIIDFVYPKGYLEMGRAKGSGSGSGSGFETWNEEEEEVRAREWEVGRRRIEGRLVEEQEKGGRGEWDRVVEELREAILRGGGGGGDGGGGGGLKEASEEEEEEQPDEILDRLEDASSTSNKSSIISKLSPRQVEACLHLASQRAIQERREALEDLQKELETTYPPRNVRAFRVLRVVDAAAAQSGAATTKRFAQLTVWDLDQLDSEYFQLDRRYLVTNVIPKGSWHEKSESIALATRKETRWQVVDGRGMEEED